jgi:hypothetical protein
MFELPEIDVEDARDGIKQCVRASGFTTDMFLLDNAERLKRCTAASVTQLTVHAALAYLFGSGLIVMAPEWPEYLVLEIPPELKADLNTALAESVARLERMNRSVSDA